MPPSTDLAHYQTLIVAMVPLGDVLGEERDPASDVRVAMAAAEKKLEVCCACLRLLARANPNTCNAGRVDQLARADELGPSDRDLIYARRSEFEGETSKFVSKLWLSQMVQLPMAQRTHTHAPEGYHALGFQCHESFSCSNDRTYVI